MQAQKHFHRRESIFTGAEIFFIEQAAPPVNGFQMDFRSEI
jgi:hypothetical protein